VANGKGREIGTQLTAMWDKLRSKRNATTQDDLTADDRPPNDGDPTHRSSYGTEVAIVNAEEEVTSVKKIPASELFSNAVAPISKLNIPTVNVNPWSAFWAVLAAMVGGTGITSYLLLIAVPPTPNCQGIIPISTDAERLYCAQVGADTKEIPKLQSAVNLVKDWTDRHPLYGESQRLLKSWSEDLMRIASKQVNEGKIDAAISTAKIVPTTSPVYDRAQESISKWSAQALDSSQIDVKFERAMKTGDWNQAFVILQSVQRMRGTYWTGFKHDRMAAKLAQEREGWDRLQEAKDTLQEKEGDGYAERAKRIELAVKAARLKAEGKNKDKVEPEIPLPSQPAPILKAMQLANQIDKSTYVYKEGQILRSKWSKHLVGLSVTAYKAQNFNGAIEIAQKVPQDVSIYAEAQDWVKLNQAHLWAGKRHMLATLDAIAQVKKIPKTSPIYNLAKAKKSNWQAMLKQETQLQWARTLGSFQQPATLSLAIATAKQVPASSEIGQTVQSEVDTWSRQIETVDNRVILAKARQIVGKGESLANLRAAVKLTGKITKDRPLGEEITGYVADWTEKIQTIEDKPILDSAIAIASQGNLSQAVATANRIAPGRALYQNAQAEIRYWNLQLMEIADRQTLDRAITIYRQGKISAAIELAASISRRSPVYGDARPYVYSWRMLLAPRSSRY
jgi:hypothetical protein